MNGQAITKSARCSVPGTLRTRQLTPSTKTTPDKDVRVENHHAYIRVETDTECIIRRETMEATLGRPFHMQELETVLSSFAGQIETSAHYMRFYLTKKL